jgi:hypothetical protein
MWLLDQYLNWPVFFDVLLSIALIAANYVLHAFGIHIFDFSKEAVTDLLNELISTSMSLGGFVLTAMAVIAASKDNTRRLKEGEVPESGKEFFYNSKAYIALIRSFSWACVVYGVGFLFFSVLRTSAGSMELQTLFHLTYLGLFIDVFTLLRCIYLIQAAVRI